MTDLKKLTEEIAEQFQVIEDHCPDNWMTMEKLILDALQKVRNDTIEDVIAIVKLESARLQLGSPTQDILNCISDSTLDSLKTKESEEKT